MTATKLQELAADASPTMRANIEKALGIAPPVAPGIKSEKPSIRIPKPRKMTQTEARYQALLTREFPDCLILFEPFALRLPGEIRYSPDFVVFSGNSIELIVETKGPRRLLSSSRSYAAFKVCIGHFPQFDYRFAEQTSEGGWAVRDIPAYSIQS